MSLKHFDHALAEVVVCAVGWVVILPAMEMTAQATALLVLVIHFKRRISSPHAVITLIQVMQTTVIPTS